MHEYDTTLKGVLTRSAGRVLAQLTGLTVERWHGTELPAVRHRRADLLGETSEGGLVHIELQSTNQSHMPRRMLQYALPIHRKFHRFPAQVVLYVGNSPFRMKGHLSFQQLTFEYKLIDIRQLDSEPLLESASLEDNVIAILARFSNERDVVRRILCRVADHRHGERGAALAELMILAGLRKLGTVIEREIEQMPILDDIMDHEVLGRERKRGIALGRAEAVAEGELRVILGLTGKRFGPVPGWARQRLEVLSAPDLEQVALRLLDVGSLEELLAH